MTVCSPSTPFRSLRSRSPPMCTLAPTISKGRCVETEKERRDDSLFALYDCAN